MYSASASKIHNYSDNDKKHFVIQITIPIFALSEKLVDWFQGVKYSSDPEEVLKVRRSKGPCILLLPMVRKSKYDDLRSASVCYS